MNQTELKNRVQRFLDELGTPVSKFTTNTKVDRSSFYRWLKGENVFSERALKRMDDYLTQYGF